MTNISEADNKNDEILSTIFSHQQNILLCVNQGIDQKLWKSVGDKKILRLALTYTRSTDGSKCNLVD